MSQLYCRRCLGSGAVLAYRSQLQSNGQTLVIETKETCRTCQGRGTR
ncbi:hypothetical protein [Nonomuraea sp. NPDC049141]